jgi:hypothetical protein
VADAGMTSAADEAPLAFARNTGRAIFTRDGDFLRLAAIRDDRTFITTPQERPRDAHRCDAAAVPGRSGVGGDPVLYWAIAMQQVKRWPIAAMSPPSARTENGVIIIMSCPGGRAKVRDKRAGDGAIGERIFENKLTLAAPRLVRRCLMSLFGNDGHDGLSRMSLRY